MFYPGLKSAFRYRDLKEGSDGAHLIASQLSHSKRWALCMNLCLNIYVIDECCLDVIL